MSNRSKHSQSVHDKKVASLAEGLKRQGFTVQADIPGYDQPTSFGGVRPDVIGRKGKERRIYEVETRDSVDTQHAEKQKQELKAISDRNSKTTFKRFMAE